MEEFKRLLTECLFVLNQVSNQPYYYLNEDRRTYSLASKIETAINKAIAALNTNARNVILFLEGITPIIEPVVVTTAKQQKKEIQKKPKLYGPCLEI